MKKALLVLILGMWSGMAFAQIQNPEENSGGFGSEEPDTAAIQYDENGNPIEAVDSASMAKPFKRIELYIDSVTNLISYLGVVEQEETNSDSLYTRAKRWANNKFGKLSKVLFEIDKKNNKLVINGVINAYVYNSKNTKRMIGTHQFKMTVWLKEGRYRYQITNLVHEGLKPNNGSPVRNYFEYYYTSTKLVKNNDKILRDADADITKLIADFVKNMKDPIIVDEEDW
ncbi:MAG: DUF4468 domain-containing protein [Bacteroidia bacterium]|jgi:hypothetical protein|nr:DUF4468 domain-containing protein [Bacteroidia bacterium]